MAWQPSLLRATGHVGRQGSCCTSVLFGASAKLFFFGDWRQCKLWPGLWAVSPAGDDWWDEMGSRVLADPAPSSVRLEDLPEPEPCRREL